MHPIVMIASDKDPAIGKAVEDLQAAGFEVRVLNSATAKLVDFLGAIAGVEDDEPEPPKEQEEKPEEKEEEKEESKGKKSEETPEEDDEEDDAGEDENDPLHPKKLMKVEACIAGEAVQVQLVEGNAITLHPSSINTGSKTFYTLNESQFSFWPNAIGNEPIVGGVELSLNGEEITQLTKVTFSEEVMTPPVLKIGSAWLKEARQNAYRNSWALLPASQVLYGKNKVTIEDIRTEMGAAGVILVCELTGSKTVFPVFLTTYGMIGKVGDVHAGHHDQTFRPFGDFRIVATITLGKTAEEDKIDGKIDGVEDLSKLKAKVFVFK